MDARRYNYINAVATGVLVLILLSSALFWARWYCGQARQMLLPRQLRQVKTSPSRLLPEEQPGDPNIASFSAVHAEMALPRSLWAGLGAMQYWEARRPRGPRSHVYAWNPEPGGLRIHYDKSAGRLVYRSTTATRQPDGTSVIKKVVWYAGPEGVGDTPGARLGRFRSPIGAVSVLNGWIVYDSELRRFFKIDWRSRTVIKGPPLPAGGLHRPVDFGELRKNPSCVGIYFSMPDAERSDGASDDRARRSLVMSDPHFAARRLLVLDASGRIDLLDTQTLEFVGRAGVLPSPETLFASKTPVTPDQVFAYAMFSLIGKEPDQEYWNYLGCAVAAVSREATAMRVAVYDPNGRGLSENATNLVEYVKTSSGEPMPQRTLSTAKALYYGLPGGPALTVCEFILENLHPPMFLLASYFTASSFEATAGYRSVFLLPDSFVARKARDVDAELPGRWMTGLALMLPSILLAAALAGSVARDSRRIGLSSRPRKVWIAAAAVFGIPAYVTYRLTRPGAALVTCGNCGLGRRTDMEKCHRCGSVWAVPELTPPAWRVLGEQEQAAEGSPAGTPETTSEVQ